MVKRSASSLSVTVVRLLDLSLRAHRRIRATARIASDQDENLDKQSTRLSRSSVLVLSATALLTSGSPIINSGVPSIVLHHKNLGPVSQVDDRSFVGVRPLEA